MKPRVGRTDGRDGRTMGGTKSGSDGPWGLVDEGAQATQLVYEHLQNVAAGLVDRPEDVPGPIIEFGDWKAGGVWVPKLDWPLPIIGASER